MNREEFWENTVGEIRARTELIFDVLSEGFNKKGGMVDNKFLIARDIWTAQFDQFVNHLMLFSEESNWTNEAD